MRRNRAFAAFLTLLLAGCTSSGAVDPSSGAPSSSAPPVSSPVSSPTSSGFTGPPKPSTPTIPADVPRTGPNTKPGEKPPLMPLEATQHTPDGAKAFAEFFVKTIDWGYATISGAYIRHYSDPGCQTCSSLASGLENDRRARDQYIGGRLTLSGSKIGKPGGPNRAQESVVVTANGTSFEKLSRTGKFLTGDEAHGGLRYFVYLRWASASWRVTEIEVQL